MITLEAVIYRHTNGTETDFELWQITDLPETAIHEIESVLARYNDMGYSVRGNANDIASELKTM